MVAKKYLTTPFSAVNFPAAMVLPPAEKLECRNTPLYFWMDKSGCTNRFSSAKLNVTKRDIRYCFSRNNASSKTLHE